MRFFFDLKHPELGSLTKFYQTILHQLLYQLQDSHLKASEICYSIVGNNALVLSAASLKAAIQQILGLLGSTYLIIDAFDECQQNGDQKLLLNWLADQELHPGMKTLITSRPKAGIKEIAEHNLCIQLELNSLVKKSNEDIKCSFKLDSGSRNPWANLARLGPPRGGV